VFPLASRAIMTRATPRVASRIHNVRHYHRLPRLNIGVRVGWFAAWWKKNVTMLAVPEFEKTRPLAILWGLSRGGSQPSAITEPALLSDAQKAIAALEKSGKQEQAVAAVDENGHLYWATIKCGTLTPRMYELLGGIKDWAAANQVVCCFAPYGMHLPGQETQAQDFVQSPNFWLTALDPHSTLRPSDRQVTDYHRSLVPGKMMEGLVALASYTIQRTHFMSAEDDLVRLWTYLATTWMAEHGLDGFAQHELVVDKKTLILYFLARGEGKHIWRSIDGANNPIALFVFSVMGRSFYRFLELQEAREKAGLPLLDIVRDPLTAQDELRKHIAQKDPQLARDRRRAALLDFLGRWLPTVRYIFGMNVVRAPLDLQFPGMAAPGGTVPDKDKPGGTGSGGTPSGGTTGGTPPGGTGSGGTGSGGPAPTPGDGGTLAVSPDAREEETEEPQRIDTAKSDSFSLWPFLLFVSLLNIDEDEPDEEQDEDDLDSFFVQITE
jgi:hypothetical protein